MAPLENELAWKLASSLADRIGGDRYELYFDSQSFSLEHGRILVQAGDDFTLERLRSQFQDEIRQTVDSVLGSDVAVFYCLHGESPQQQSLFPDLDLETKPTSKNPAKSDQQPTITTAALSLDNDSALAIPTNSTDDPWYVDSRNALPSSNSLPSSNRSEIADNLTSQAPQLAAGDSSKLGRIAPAVKRNQAEINNGQMSLFCDQVPSTSSDDSRSEISPRHGNPRANSVGTNHSASSSTEPTTVSTVSTSVSENKSNSFQQNFNSQAKQFAPKAPQAKPTLPGSRAAMTLATFQFGDENQLAKAAMEQVLQRPGLISPVVIHGPVGCGKSHLATGLGQQLRGVFRAFSVLHLSAEQFTSRFLEALNGSGLPSMRAKFREMDMLVLEDIQFFRNKKATIIELQHTIDALIKAGKQVVVTADRHPNDLTFLGSEVQTRLVSGLVVSLNPADREARAEICRQWCARQGMKIEESLVQWMADHIVGDVRRLSGALFRVLALQMSTGKMVTGSTAMDLLSDYVSASHSICSLGQIQKVVCDVCGVDAKELNGSKRTRKVSGARMLAMFLARKHTQAALSEIGDFFGGRRHSTVLAAEKRIKSWEQKNELIETGLQAINTREVIRKVEAKLQAM